MEHVLEAIQNREIKVAIMSRQVRVEWLNWSALRSMDVTNRGERGGSSKAATEL
jgi:hypothetical protein